MKKIKNRILKASFVAILGSLFVLVVTPKDAAGFSWRWPFHHAHPAAALPAPQNANVPGVSGTIENRALRGNSEGAIVLMYHHVGDISAGQRNADPVLSDLTVSVADFESQVKYFHDAGFASVTVSDLYASLAAGKSLAAKPVVFTFDDGYEDVFVNAIPVLQKYGFTGSFAVATELLGRPGYAVWDDVISADQSGMEILSHTENHLDLTSKVYSAADLSREISGSKQILEEKLGHPVDFFAYPYGHTNEKITALVGAAGYKMAFTTAYGVRMDPKTMLTEPRVRVHGTDGLAKLKGSVFSSAK